MALDISSVSIYIIAPETVIRTVFDWLSKVIRSGIGCALL